MPGPLPKPDARRRNKPTIPTTDLPAQGRKGSAPKCPYPLAKAGSAWWKWAWKLPQAAAWDDGALYAVARRAQLEDSLAALEFVDEFDLGALLGMDDNETIRQIQFVVGRLKAAAGGSTSLMREMRELDNRLGLNPKALSDLRWRIVDDAKPAAPVAPAPAKLPPNVTRIRAVDPKLAAG